MIITGGVFTGAHLHKVDLPLVIVTGSLVFNVSSLTNRAGVTLAGSPSQVGNYLVFTGNESLTTDPIVNSTLTNNDITYEIWLRTTGSASGSILAKIGTGGYHCAAMELSTTDLVTGYWAGAFQQYNVAATITRDVWQHYAVTYQTDGARKNYLNGVLQSTANNDPEVSPYSYNLYETTFQLFGLETTNFGNGGPLTCNFGEFRLYTRTLTDAEVLQNYLATRSRW